MTLPLGMPAIAPTARIIASITARTVFDDPILLSLCFVKVLTMNNDDETGINLVFFSPFFRVHSQHELIIVDYGIIAEAG